MPKRYFPYSLDGFFEFWAVEKYRTGCNRILHLCHTFTLKSFAMIRCDTIKIWLFPTITFAKKG